MNKIKFKFIIYFMITTRMYFFFLTCEVKCDATILDVVNRQNVHNIIIIVKNIVELYKTIKREKEFHREILVFLISHDHSSIKIYDHYFLINEDKIIFYYHLIHKFDFTILKSKEK